MNYLEPVLFRHARIDHRFLQLHKRLLFIILRLMQSLEKVSLHLLKLPRLHLIFIDHLSLQVSLISIIVKNVLGSVKAEAIHCSTSLLPLEINHVTSLGHFFIVHLLLLLQPLFFTMQ